jgi:hypothetical protein
MEIYIKTAGYSIYSNANRGWYRGNYTTTGSGVSNGKIVTLNPAHGQTASSNYHYIFELTTIGTSTDSGATYIGVYSANTSAWSLRAVSLSGGSSNHPQLSVSGNNFTVYTNHSSNYTVVVSVTSVYNGDADSTAHSLGANYQWQRAVNDLYYNDGLVGIGTGTPSQKLHVQGNLRVTGAYYDSNNATGTSGQVLTSTGSATDWKDLDEISGVTGSGTTNYVTKWTDGAGEVIGNSLIYDNGANVGIGTNSPQGKLDINTEAAQATHVYINGEVNQDKLLYFRHYANSEGAGNNAYVGYIGSKGVDNLLSLGHLNTSGTDVSIMHLTEAGNVGIGTTNPGTLLDVRGIVSVRESSNIAFYGGNYIRLFVNANFSIREVGGATRLNLDTTNGDLSLYNSSTVLTNHIDTAGDSYFNGGNVGIGTANPSEKLHVNGLTQLGAAGKTEGGAIINYASFSEIKNAAATLIGNAVVPGTANNTIQHSKTDAGNYIKLKYNQGITFHTNITNSIDTDISEDTNESVRIDLNGNVGIGTVSPISKLHVFNDNIDTRGFNVQNSTVQLYFDPINGNSAGDSNTIGSGITWKPNYATYTKRSAGILQIGEGNYFRSGLAFYTNNTANQTTDWSERMRISMEGNVGIGTTNPGVTLDVRGKLSIGSPNASYDLYNNGTTYLNGSVTIDALLSITGTSASQSIINSSSTDSAAADSYLNIFKTAGSGGGSRATLRVGYDAANCFQVSRIRNDSNIYINSRQTGSAMVFQIADSAKMTLLSTGQLQLSTYGSGTFTGTATQRLAVDSSGNVIEIPIGAGAVDGAGTTGYISIWTDSDTIGNSVIYQENGNVGIGTVSPSQKLHVVGKALITDDVQLTGSSPRIDFNTNGSSSLRFYDTTNAAERMRINTSGNVGINTTSPTSKLQIVGSTSGDSVLRVDGTNGTLFEVVDDLSDSLMSVNDAAGLPVFEVFADNTIVGGRYNKNDFYLQGSSGKIGIGTDDPDATALTIQDLEGSVISGTKGVFALKNYAGVVTHRFSSQYVTNAASQAYATYWLYNPVNSSTAFYVRVDNTLGPRLQLNNSSGSSSVYLSTYAGVSTTFNVGLENIDFNVRGDSDINLFYADASTDRIGIGTASPAVKLEVNGDATVAGDLSAGGSAAANRTLTINSVAQAGRPAAKINNPNLDTATASDGRTFHGWLPIDLDGTVKYIPVYN